MDKAAFDALYREHYRRVYGLCRRMLGRTVDAEDATQEVFMRGYRSFGRYRSQDPFGPWINSIATNYCIDVLRGNRRVRDLFSEDAEPDEAESPLENGAAPLIRAENAESVNQAVEALPEQYRLPIVLAYYSDASYDEIAETLGVTRNHVGVLLLRGRKKLRAEIAGQTSQEN
jgi:RNA polymerase sigma-70 factor (ECF subfamily)